MDGWSRVGGLNHGAPDFDAGQGFLVDIVNDDNRRVVMLRVDHVS